MRRHLASPFVMHGSAHDLLRGHALTTRDFDFLDALLDTTWRLLGSIARKVIVVRGIAVHAAGHAPLGSTRLWNWLE